MAPAFDIQGGLPLAMARAVSVAGLAAAFGTTLFGRVVAPGGLRAATQRKLRLAGWAGIGAGIAGALLWWLAQTRDMAGAVSAADLWAVLGGTQFGHLVAARLVLLGLAAAAWRRWPAGSVVLTGAAMAAQAGHSHAFAMDAAMGGACLVVAATVHVLAAGAWLGSLPALWLVVSGEEAGAAARAARRYSRLGLVCVAALMASALVQGWTLLGGFPGVVGTGYGWMAVAKAVLLGGLLVLATRNRFVHCPELATRAHAAHPAPAHADQPALAHAAQPAQAHAANRAQAHAANRALARAAHRALARNIALEIGLGLMVLAAAGVLTELPPAMHTQSVWPFPYRISVEAVREDPDLLREALLAGAAAAAAVLALAGSLGWGLVRPHGRRGLAMRAGVGVAALAGGWLAAPHLSVLFVPAYPTWYFRSPTGFSVQAVADGGALYGAHCAACHGASGHGDGPAAAGLPVPPADLTAAHLWMHPDGELFWWLAHGMAAPDGRAAMPGFAASLSDEQRWDLIDYVRAHNAGVSVGADGRWGHAVRAPEFEVACTDGALPLSAFAGTMVRLVLDAPAVAVPGLVTIAAGGPAAPGICVARDGRIGAAYGVASGLGGDARGATFLIDGDGMLRRVWRPGAAVDLAGAVADVQAHRVSVAGGNGGRGDMGGMKM